MSARLELTDSRAEAAALANLVASVADNKYFLAHRLARWGVGAPALESAVACTAIAQEEAGHARGLYSLLEDFPPELRPVPLDREDDRERKYAVSFLVEASDSWYRAVAAQALIDFALTTLLEACVGSSVAELRKRADRILADEGFHRRYVEGRLRELGSTPAEASILEDELAALLPETLCWFGPPGEPGLELLVDAGDRRARQRDAARALPGRHARASPRARACVCPRRESCRGSGGAAWSAGCKPSRRPATTSRARGARRSRSSGSASSGPAS